MTYSGNPQTIYPPNILCAVVLMNKIFKYFIIFLVILPKKQVIKFSRSYWIFVLNTNNQMFRVDTNDISTELN